MNYFQFIENIGSQKQFLDQQDERYLEICLKFLQS